MTDAALPPPPPPPGPARMDPGTEEAIFYHESAVNAAWTGSRLAIGGLTFLFGAFAFAFFYLRALNSSGRWQGPGFQSPPLLTGTVIMFLVLVSAGIHYAALQQIKVGRKQVWQIGGLVALALGLAAVGLQIAELLSLPFWPGSSGYASVFTGFYPVFLVIVLAAMVWLEMLLASSRFIPAMSFLEQPPTYAEAFRVQRFQARLSSFSTVWNYLAVIAIVFWLLFYVI
jgi:heme/copper-type cytochrome/quinol oxidase subunit 3